jgi:hypothetical protein
MDVLSFVKEEYEGLRARMPQLLGGDMQILADKALHEFLMGIKLIVRIADELILPELAEATQRGIRHLADAGDQTNTLGRLVSSSLKSGKVGDAKRREIYQRLTSHLDLMEQAVLPLLREEISTSVREELCVVARDYKFDSGYGTQMSAAFAVVS